MTSAIIVLYGLPCTGKTAISNILSELVSCKRINIDNIWNDKFPNPQFTLEESEVVYNELLGNLSSDILEKWEVIIVEGVFASITRLIKIQELAEKAEYKFISVLLYNTMENLIELNFERNKIIKNQITINTLNFLESKFNSKEFSTIVINTSKVSFKKAARLIINLTSDGE